MSHTQQEPSKDSNTFEAAIESLQGIVKRMEGGELTLEQSLQHFEEGVRVARSCQETLAAAEQRVELLMKVNADGSAQTQPFGNQRG